MGKGTIMLEGVQELFEQLAKDNQVSVEDIQSDLQKRIDTAWADQNESSAVLRRFFKDKKPTAVFFLFAFDQIQKMNDQIQEIIEEVYLTEMKAGGKSSVEVTGELDADQIQDPIETFLAILNCLQSNALIIETIRQMDCLPQEKD